MPSKTILYIDDDACLLDIYSELMRDEGHDVWPANCGEKGLGLLEKKGIPDVIFVDYFMPTMNGEEFLLLAKERFPNIANAHIIGFTGNVSSNPYTANFKKIVSKMICKPNDLDKFVEIVRQL